MRNFKMCISVVFRADTCFEKKLLDQLLGKLCATTLIVLKRCHNFLLGFTKLPKKHLRASIRKHPLKTCSISEKILV